MHLLSYGCNVCYVLTLVRQCCRVGRCSGSHDVEGRSILWCLKVNTSKRNDKYSEISAYLKLNVFNIREIKLLPTLIQLIGISLESWCNSTNKYLDVWNFKTILVILILLILVGTYYPRKSCAKTQRKHSINKIKKNKKIEFWYVPKHLL